MSYAPAHRLRLVVTIVLLGGVLAALSATRAQARPIIGIADQKPVAFLDARIKQLGITHARLYVPWDVLSDPRSLVITDSWMFVTRAQGISPLITIDRSHQAGKASVNPSPAQLTTQVRLWRRRWPQIKELSAWNEGNINKRPELVAKWWLAVRTACPTCKVLASDLVDRNNAISWAQRLIKTTQKLAKRTPTLWGLHNYVDTNTMSTKRTTAFLKAIKGNVWLTETGGVVRRRSTAVPFAGTGTTFAARATSFLLTKIAPLSPRIQRIYIYQWSAGDDHDPSWDSGLVDPMGLARPALTVLAGYLHRVLPGLPGAPAR